MLCSDDVYDAEDAWLDACEAYGQDSPEAEVARKNYRDLKERYHAQCEEEDGEGCA